MKTSDLVAAVSKAEDRLAELYPDTVATGKGRRATIRSMAVADVAKKLGMQENAVRQAMKRANKSKPRALRGAGEHFDFLGVPVSEAFRLQCSEVLRVVRVTSERLGTAKQALTRMAARYPFPAPYLKQWLESFEEVFNRTRGLQPVGVCPWCKNLASYRDNCAGCYGFGILLRAKAHAVPARLKEQPTLVIQGGDERRVDLTKQAPDKETAPEEPLPWET